MSDTLAPVLLVNPDPINTPNGRVLTVGDGLKKTDNGPGTTFLIEPSGKLTSLALMGSSGMIAYNDVIKNYIPRHILGASGINVQNGDGKNGDPLITIQPASTVQLIRVANGAGAIQATVPQVNLKAGTGISVAINSVGSGTAAEVVISSVGAGSGTVTSVNATSSDASILVSGGPISVAGSLDLRVGVLGVSHGAVGQTTYTIGDTLYASATTTLSKLAVGPNHSIMSSTGTAPSWVATTAPLTGQVLTYDGASIVWQTPTSSGTVTSVGLTTAQPSELIIANTPITSAGNISINIGVVSAIHGGSGLSTYAVGDVLYASAIHTLSTLPIGSANRVLVSDGIHPVWAAGSPIHNQILTYDSSFGVVWKDTPNIGVTSVGAISSDGSINVSNSPITSTGDLDLQVGIIGISHGAVGLDSYNVGDISYYSGGDTLTALTIGADNTILASTGSGPLWVGGTALSGNVLTYDGTAVVWATPATSGTVTSVGLTTATSAALVITGSPVTSAGDINIDIGVVAETQGGTNQIAYITGDTLYSSASNTLSKLPIGGVNRIMSSTGTAPAWVGGLPISGNVLTYNGINIVWAAPATSGTVTSVNAASSDASILVSGGPITAAGSLDLQVGILGVSHGAVGQTTYTVGDTLYASATTTLSKLAIGGSNRIMSSTGTAPAWVGGAPVFGNVLTYNGTTIVWAAPATSGTVTSVGLTTATPTALVITGSPVTGSSSINVNIGVVSEIQGGTNQTTYTTGDTLYASGANVLSKLLIGGANRILSSTGTAPAWVGGAPVSGNVLTYNGSSVIWAAPATSGTVTSVGLTQSLTDFTISNTPVVNSGNILINLNTVNLTKGGLGLTSLASGSLVYGPPSGNTVATLGIGAVNTVLTSTGALPSWVGGTAASGNVLTYNGTTVVWSAPATSGTVTSVGLTQSGTDFTISNTPISTSGNILINLNTVPTSKGGLGQTTYTAGDLVYYASGTAFTKLAIGAANRIMSSTGTAPAWVGGAPVSGNVLTYNGTTVIWAPPATSGTVTSVGLTTATSAALVITGSPVTGSSSINVNVGLISEIQGGTNQTTYTTGDTLYASGTNTLSKLGIGATNRILSSNGTAPAWVGGAPLSGNVLTYNGTTVIWAAPATSGTVTSVGLTTATPTALVITGSPVTGASSINVNIGVVSEIQGGTNQTTYTTGDTLYASASNTLSKLGIGAANRILSSSGTAPAWVGGAPASGNVLTYNGTTIVWAAPATNGTVTSIGLVQGGSDFTISGTPVTTSGNISITLNTVPTSTGGLGLITYTAGDLVYYSTGTAFTRIPIGAAKTLIASNGTLPSWTTRDALGIVYATTLVGAPTAGITGALTANLTINTTAIKSNSFVHVCAVSDVAGLLGARGYTTGYDSIVANTSFRIVINLNGSTSVTVTWLIVTPITT